MAAITVASLPTFVTFAFAAALLRGLDPVLTKRGLAAGGTWLQSTFILLVIRLVLFWSALIAIAGIGGALAGLTPLAVAVFAGASLVATVLGRPALYVGIDRVGSTVSNAVVNGRPLFSVLFGAVLLGEVVPISLWFGVLVLVVGLVTVTFSRGGDIGGWSLVDIGFPLLAGLAFTTGNVLRRHGFETTPTTVLQAVTIGETVALFAMLGLVLAIPRLRPVWTAHRRVYWYFAGGNLLASLAILAMFAALQAGPVSIVDPIVASAPLVTVAVAAVALRDVERITARLIVGVVLAVLGVVLVTVRPF